LLRFIKTIAESTQLAVMRVKLYHQSTRGRAHWVSSIVAVVEMHKIEASPELKMAPLKDVLLVSALSSISELKLDRVATCTEMVKKICIS